MYQTHSESFGTRQRRPTTFWKKTTTGGFVSFYEKILFCMWKIVLKRRPPKAFICSLDMKRIISHFKTAFSCFPFRFRLIRSADANQKSKFPNNLIKIYSLKDNTYEKTMRFRSEVQTFCANQRLFVVGLAERIYGFDSNSIQRIFTLQCFPFLALSSISLGPRWVRNFSMCLFLNVFVSKCVCFSMCLFLDVFVSQCVYF